MSRGARTLDEKSVSLYPLVMALPLYAILALALSARAQPAFQATVAASFQKGEDLAAISSNGQPADLAALYDQARYVQGGREPGDDLETHQTFVRSVARRLGVKPETAIELYGARVRAARVAAASRRELAARTALASDVAHNPGISPEKKARVAKSMSATSEYLRRGLNGDAGFVGEANVRPEVVRGREVDFAGVTDRPSEWATPRARAIPVAAKETPPPLPGASAGALSWSTLTSWIDWERGKEVAHEAYTNTLEYTKKMGRMCYRFFKQALIDAGVIDAPNPQSVALVGLRPGAAAMFNADVKKRPQILETMGYRQVDLARLPDDAELPDGAALVYGAGCGFADDKYGHAELVVSETTYEGLRAKNSRLKRLDAAAGEIRVCHFSCTTRRLTYLRSLGRVGCLGLYLPVKKS